MITSKEQFDMELRGAIKKYEDHHIDIAVEGLNVYGFYHSSNNSFGVTETYNLNDLGGKSELVKYEEEFENLCICEG